MRYLITGGSGYIGTRLVDRLSRREDTESIVICDVAAPRTFVPKTEFQKIDVRDRQAVRGRGGGGASPTCSCTSPSSSTPRTTRASCTTWT